MSRHEFCHDGNSSSATSSKYVCESVERHVSLSLPTWGNVDIEAELKCRGEL